MTMQEMLHANGELVIKIIREAEGAQLDYDEASVAWIQDYIERNRHLSAETIDGLVSVLGSFLGECMCRQYEGQWQESQGQWGVSIDTPRGPIVAFPITKVRKQFENGVESGDSILGFFRTTGVIKAQGI